MLIGMLVGGAAGWVVGRLWFALAGPKIYRDDDPEYRSAIAENFPVGLAAVGALVGAVLGALA